MKEIIEGGCNLLSIHLAHFLQIKKGQFANVFTMCMHIVNFTFHLPKWLERVERGLLLLPVGMITNRTGSQGFRVSLPCQDRADKPLLVTNCQITEHRTVFSDRTIWTLAMYGDMHLTETWNSATPAGNFHHLTTIHKFYGWNLITR